jgi:glycosyltransferase involved in cell wall biosynthesis
MKHIKTSLWCLLFMIPWLHGREEKPLISCIVSVYNGNEFIEGFLEDILRLPLFSRYEFLIARPNDSPGQEDAIIAAYAARYPNIRYIRVTKDPGLYALWNILIIHASADFITNMNIDDRRNPHCLERQRQILQDNPDLDLVYSSYYETNYPNDTFEDHHELKLIHAREFDARDMHECLPGPQPLWRKSMHEKYGFFMEQLYSAADWEFWNRAVSLGALFGRVKGVSGIYYRNPKGVSTNDDPDKITLREQAVSWIRNTYEYMWRL